MEKITLSHKNRADQHRVSHLTTLASRFLRTLEDMKSWNKLDSLKGENELRRHLSNIIEYTFYFHRKQITIQEIESIVRLLEKGGS